MRKYKHVRLENKGVRYEMLQDVSSSDLSCLICSQATLPRQNRFGKMLPLSFHLPRQGVQILYKSKQRWKTLVFPNGQVRREVGKLQR